MTTLLTDPHVTGASLIAGRDSSLGDDTFTAFDPSTAAARPVAFTEATPAEVDAAVEAAAEAFVTTRSLPATRIADLIDGIATRVEELGDRLLTTAAGETGLAIGRLTTERSRTCEQLRSFARLLRDGWYVDAIIDPTDPQAVPVPRPDVRRMLFGVGPIAVFGASNFPLAFSVPGGDTASALAAGCPVVVKAHPSHPETSELCGRAINAAVADAGLPAGTFSLLQGRTNETGGRLVQAPGIAAVGFTGSHGGGRALFDLASRRPVPIPVYAEMGSINPVVITPGALAARGDAVAEGLVDSVLLGHGQFCTKPGFILVPQGGDGDAAVDRMAELVAGREPACMLSDQIRTTLNRRLEATLAVTGEGVVRRGPKAGDSGVAQQAALVVVSAQTVRDNPDLMSEHFGPVSLVVRYEAAAELEELLGSLPGGLTATIHAESHETGSLSGVLSILREKTGRLIWNGYPTGVSVTGAMMHGGPYPASTTPAHTSVGWTAIRRFLRPVAFQDVPNELLPPALRDENPLGILRLVDGTFTTDPVRR